jgi:ABC-2 type transport system ATP-binding protein
MDTAAVRVQGLTKVYTQAFRRHPVPAGTDVDLEVAPGEIFGLLGPNGAGKTTLVKILLGIVRPTEGRADLFGIPAADPRSRRRIGFLPENHRFPDFMTPGQLLDHYGRLAGVPAEDRRRRIPELLERVRMGKWKHVRIKKFSKGMMQRVGLAQALLNRPALVFLDEPTDGVDPIGRREIRDLLLWLRGEGTTVFLNSHLLSEVEQVCTRVAILNAGRLVRQGTIAELTMLDRVYDVTATSIPPATREALGSALATFDAPAAAGLHRYRVQAGDRSALNAILDRLRADGVQFEAVHPVRRSLEDYFIEVVTQSS